MAVKHFFNGCHGKMSYIKIEGKKDFPTIIFMDGFGGANNYLGLKNIAKRIDIRYTKLFIDRLGVCESDETIIARTWENIVFEIRELIEHVVKKPILFFAHSANGPLALAYQHTYPEDVLGIIGVEPTTKNGEVLFQTKAYKAATSWMNNLSTVERNQIFIDPEWTEEEKLEEERTAKHIIEGSTLFNEYLMGQKNLQSISQLPKIKNLPMLIFLQPFREEEYRCSEYAENDTTYILMDGHHYLHRIHPDNVAKEVNHWLNHKAGYK
ncbi:alpha/beta fold hydrolase [Solibacillus silvestris]|uniref:alpha/beta fold hydrolase n=1 Tax=Solibacillus silvestris TaxID=76853 RepID=UPI003F7EAA52